MDSFDPTSEQHEDEEEEEQVLVAELPEDNVELEDEQSEAYSVYAPPKRRLFSCGGADNDLVQDLTLTLRQIFSPIKNAEIVVPEKNKKAFRVMMKEKIRYHCASRNDSYMSDESSYSDHSSLYSKKKFDEKERKRSDEVRVGTPDSPKRLV